ncbi:hypothetical protein [uncultured Pontibacter sp.]|uniref:O-antigen ligase family protein n=1 Tax=uncultured Pontibacter sp. TaxID=453356 RepID=UPI00260FD61E|nr:hypothetical protein [uncultured Pontibacter sp.]
MNLFFLSVELFAIALTIYLLLYKKELSIIYIPVLIFARIVVTPLSPAMLYYATISILLFYCIYKNSSFFSENIFSLCLIILYLILVTRTTDFEAIRPGFFACLWLFLSLPLISSIYKKHSREIIFKELSTAAFLILCLFILNVIVSTMAGYSPHMMYGITSGILYGNLYATDFNILAIAAFVILAYAVRRRNAIYFITFMISLAFILLSLRRSVMGLSLLGIGIILFIFSTQKNIRNVIILALTISAFGAIVIMNTSFMTTFIQRYEQRKLAERELSEEKRFLEYEILYDDLFSYEDYSPLFGYELLNSAGNYGKGILDERTLHSDVTNIVHSSGLIGLSLYFLMIITCFVQAFKNSKTKEDILLIMFCASVFVVYTITGRYTSSESMIFLFLTLMLSLSIKEDEVQELEEHVSTTVTPLAKTYSSKV